MSRTTKRRARIWNKYICPAIEIVGYSIVALATVIGLYAMIVMLILMS